MSTEDHGGEAARVNGTREVHEPDWRQLCEQTPFGLAQVGVDRGLVWANQAWCAPIGLRQHDVAGTDVADLVHPDERGRVHEFTSRASVGSGSGGTLCVRFVHRDGGDVVLHLAIAASFDGSGALAGWLVQTAPPASDPAAASAPSNPAADIDTEHRRLAALLERSRKQANEAVSCVKYSERLSLPQTRPAMNQGIDP